MFPIIVLSNNRIGFCKQYSENNSGNVQTQINEVDPRNRYKAQKREEIIKNKRKYLTCHKECKKCLNCGRYGFFERHRIYFVEIEKHNKHDNESINQDCKGNRENAIRETYSCSNQNGERQINALSKMQFPI